MPNIVNLIVGSLCPRVRATAQGYGTCSYVFSQVSPPVGDLIGTVPASAGGICELLSAKWVELHAKGTSLSAWLGNPIDPSKIRMVMQYFIIGESMSPKHMIGKGTSAPNDQTKATKIYLESRGLRMMIGATPGRYDVVSGKVDRGKGKRRVMAHNLALKVVSTHNPYVMIGVWGPGGAHAMAAHLAGDTVLYFDPNFGEFTFTSRASFVDWLPKFWHTSFYGNAIKGLSDRGEVIEYAVGAAP
jgi:YopT peptidase